MMKLSVRSLVIIAFTGLSTPAALADDVFYCPSGTSGDWTWRADYSSVKFENPNLKLDWSTVGTPDKVETSGLRIEATSEDGANIRAIRLYLPSPAFSIDQDIGDTKRAAYMFDDIRRHQTEESGPAGSIPNVPKHDYAITAFKYVGDGASEIFSGRKETWTQGYSKEIVAQLLQTAPESLGWSIAEESGMAFLIQTQYFKQADYYGNVVGWDKIARSEPIDLTTIKPALNDAIKGLQAAYDHGKATKSFCTKPEAP